MLHARETAGLAATYCAAAPAEAICRHLAVLGWCLKASLRAGEDDSDVVSTMLPPATAETVLAARKRPVALLRGAHAVVAEEVAAGRLDAQAHLSLLTQLHSLNAQIGECERLLASPVPPTITRHKSRVRACPAQVRRRRACPSDLVVIDATQASSPSSSPSAVDGVAPLAVIDATHGRCVEIKLHAPHATDAHRPRDRPDRARPNSRSSCARELLAAALTRDAREDDRRRAHRIITSLPLAPPPPAPPRPRACSGTSRRPPSRARAAPCGRSSCSGRVSTTGPDLAAPVQHESTIYNIVARGITAGTGRRTARGATARIRRKPVAVAKIIAANSRRPRPPSDRASSSKWRSDAPGSFSGLARIHIIGRPASSRPMRPLPSQTKVSSSSRSPLKTRPPSSTCDGGDLPDPRSAPPAKARAPAATTG